MKDISIGKIDSVKNKKKKVDKVSTIITTHINPDFDAIASMFAAQKLYPDSAIVFPDTHEENLRNFFISSLIYLYNMEDIDSIDFSRVKTLVILDTKSSKKIGKAAKLLKNPGIDIHIYDHHPKRSDDIKGKQEYIETVGATITILTEIIKRKRIRLTSDEATTMCLGIYEDTGSFSFSSTTERDFIAASYLLSKGANIDIISSILTKEIVPQGIELLNDMIQSAISHKINGVDVIISRVESKKYLNNLASFVQKIIRMENFTNIFVLVRMDNKIFIVGRSNIPEVDAGEIITELGGGGHSYASSAIIKNKTLVQTEQLLLDILNKKVKPLRSAKNVMTFPPITIKPDMSCNDANLILTRYNINTIPVVSKSDNKQVIHGYITRKTIQKALFHKLTHVPVSDYMNTEFTAVKPDSVFAEIQEKIVEKKQLILPVVENDILIGVITRSDLLEIFVNQNMDKKAKFANSLKKTVNTKTKNIINKMNERLPKKILTLIKDIGNIADKLGYNAYIVGGFVRDLLLYKKNEDIDIVIEGDGIKFAKRYAEISNAHVNIYEKFGTAVIVLKDGFKIDIASSRLEYYNFPAALPTVEMSSIKLDLFRRDFTINTLAIHLNSENFGTLIDFFGAHKDLKDKAIRIIHNLSFVEDPTRVFRAIRFEQRFGFRIGKLTGNLIENAVKMDFVKKLSGLRVFNELKHILEEDDPLPSISRLFDFNLFNVIHPSIKYDENLLPLLVSVKKVISWHDLLFLDEGCMRWAVYLMVIIKHCNKKISYEICSNLKLRPAYQKLIADERLKTIEFLFWIDNNLPVKNSKLYDRLNGFKTETILFMMAINQKDESKKEISFYFTQLRNKKILIKGSDLKKMGYKPGPVYKKIFKSVLESKLDGKLKTKQDELEFIKKWEIK